MCSIERVTQIQNFQLYYNFPKIPDVKEEILLF